VIAAHLDTDCAIVELHELRFGQPARSLAGDNIPDSLAEADSPLWNREQGLYGSASSVKVATSPTGISVGTFVNSYTCFCSSARVVVQIRLKSEAD